MKGFKGDIEEITSANKFFRQVLYTAKNSPNSSCDSFLARTKRRR